LTSSLDYPVFPLHQQLKTYFESYCEYFGLFPSIKLEHEVIRAEKIGEGKGWRIETSSKYGHETWTFDKLVVSTGRFGVPVFPKVEDLDKFQGSLIHTVAYDLFRSCCKDLDTGRQMNTRGKTSSS
jgi:cation diffusion facilitator CzcD-associated flavoprotein CzcO